MIWSVLLGLAPADPVTLEARCAVARAHIEQQLVVGKQPPVFDAEPVFVPLLDQRPQWGDMSGTAVTEAPGPSAALWAAFVAEPGRNAVAACPSVRALLDERKVAYGERAIARETGNGRHSRWRVLAVSVPALDPVSGDAIIVESSSCGSLCGGGVAYQLRRDSAGAWKPIAVLGLYVS